MAERDEERNAGVSVGECLPDGVATCLRMGAAIESLRIADALVRKMPFEIADERVRCHEVARVVGRCLDGWEIADGHWGPYEHSWLVSPSLRMILDVYAIGRLPLVQIVEPFAIYGADYREGPERTDIRHGTIESLCSTVSPPPRPPSVRT